MIAGEIQREQERAARGASVLDKLAAERRTHQWPNALDLEALAEQEPEPPKFIIDDWLPCGYATLFAGHGGVGKSGIALHLAVCIAAGIPFFGMKAEPRRVLYLSCEDRKPILHWRLARICAHLGVDLAKLRGRLEIIDLVGHDAVLWERDPRTGYASTLALEQLRERIAQYETEVLIVDGISDTYGGNENAKSDVKRYVNALLALMPPELGALVLVGHIAKQAAISGAGTEGYSGTTGWHNAVRARWYLYPETSESEDGGRRARTGELILELQKTNHGKMDQEMRFRWSDDAHLFIGAQVGNSRFDRKHQDREETAGVLRAMMGCTNAGITVYAGVQGQYTTFAALSLRPEFPPTLRAGNASAKRRFHRILEALRQSRAIEEAEYRRKNRKTGVMLVLTAEGMRQCAE